MDIIATTDFSYLLSHIKHSAHWTETTTVLSKDFGNLLSSPNHLWSISCALLLRFTKWFWALTSGPGPDQNPTIAELVVGVVHSPKLTIRTRFNGNLLTHLKCAGCQQVAEWVHLKIHITLLFLQIDNSILLKLGIQQPMSSFCMFCSLRYRLLWNPCFSF